MISLIKAREYLPADYEISDADLSSLLADLYAIADIAIDQVLSTNNQTYAKEKKERP